MGAVPTSSYWCDVAGPQQNPILASLGFGAEHAASSKMQVSGGVSNRHPRQVLHEGQSIACSTCSPCQMV